MPASRRPVALGAALLGVVALSGCSLLESDAPPQASFVVGSRAVQAEPACYWAEGSAVQQAAGECVPAAEERLSIRPGEALRVGLDVELSKKAVWAVSVGEAQSAIQEGPISGSYASIDVTDQVFLTAEQGIGAGPVPVTVHVYSTDLQKQYGLWRIDLVRA